MTTDTATASPTGPHLVLQRNPLRLRTLEVSAVERPTPRLVRISLTGPELEGFRSDGPGDHVKVFFPRPGETRPTLPQLGPDGIVPGDGPRPVARDYTPRHHRLDEGVLELDFVVHEGGYASAWAQAATVGDVLGVGGPRGSHVPTGTFGGLVLAGDETALPAMQNWLRWAPAGLPVTMLVEVQDAADEQPLDTRAALDARWVHRGDAPVGGDALVDAVRQLDRPSADTFCWLAGETGVVRRMREHLVGALGVDPARIDSRGYWKLGAEDHQEPHAD